jgi:hypothetical protein
MLLDKGMADLLARAENNEQQQQPQCLLHQP